MSFKCPNCEKQYPKLISLSVHFRKFHKGTSKKLYVLLYHNGQEPTCGCGCGGEVRYLDSTRGFREFVRGHAARIPSRNNFVSKKAQKNSAKTRRKMWKEGKLQIWNKGETKESHPSVAQYGKSGSKTISSNPEELKIRSGRMKKGRLDGTVRTLHGPEHSQWKDGTSSLHSYCHSNPLLHKLWKTPKILELKFTCQTCDCTFKRGDLHVHHDKEKMCDIIRKVANGLGWNETIHSSGLENGFQKLKTPISNAVANYHVQNNVSGVVLCKECHGKEHGNLNFK